MYDNTVHCLFFVEKMLQSRTISRMTSQINYNKCHAYRVHFMHNFLPAQAFRKLNCKTVTVKNFEGVANVRIIKADYSFSTFYVCIKMTKKFQHPNNLCQQVYTAGYQKWGCPYISTTTVFPKLV